MFSRLITRTSTRRLVSGFCIPLASAQRTLLCYIKITSTTAATNSGSSWGGWFALTGALTCAAVMSLPNETKCRDESFSLQQAYDIEDMLGIGSYGKVYKAKRKSDGTVVALKVMSQELTGDDELEREINALTKLSVGGGHSHIVKMYDKHGDGQNFFLVMELIEGGELFDHLIRKGPYCEAEAAKFLRHFAEGLAFMHSRNLAHNDLKPENLMLSSWNDNSAQLKVVDFGCALPTDENGQCFERANGTVAYWSPELAKGDARPAFASDMFAAGCIVYILLTGTHPLDPQGDASDDDIKDMLAAIMSSPAAEQTFFNKIFDERVKNLSKSSIDLIKRLMNPDPAKRMTSEEFLRHPWIQGLEASWSLMDGIDQKLENFWQKRFKTAILQKYAKAMGIGGKESLSDANLRQIFHSLDLDGSGTLDPHEIRLALRKLGVPDQQVSHIIASVDLDKSGEVDWHEFRTIMRKRFDETPGVQISDRFRWAILAKYALTARRGHGTLSDQQLRHVFNSVDLDGNGVLDVREVLLLLRRIDIADEYLSEIMQSLDLDSNGVIDFEEFEKVMRSTRQGSKATGHSLSVV